MFSTCFLSVAFGDLKAARDGLSVMVSSIAIGREGGVAPLIALARSDSEVRCPSEVTVL